MKAIPEELAAKIDEVKSWMFDGDQDEVAKRARKSRVYVNRVLNKHVFNPEILRAGIEVMNENKAMMEVSPVMKVAS